MTQQKWICKVDCCFGPCEITCDSFMTFNMDGYPDKPLQRCVAFTDDCHKDTLPQWERLE